MHFGAGTQLSEEPCTAWQGPSGPPACVDPVPLPSLLSSGLPGFQLLLPIPGKEAHILVVKLLSAPCVQSGPREAVCSEQQCRSCNVSPGPRPCPATTPAPAAHCLRWMGTHTHWPLAVGSRAARLGVRTGSQHAPAPDLPVLCVQLLALGAAHGTTGSLICQARQSNVVGLRPRALSLSQSPAQLTVLLPRHPREEKIMHQSHHLGLTFRSAARPRPRPRPVRLLRFLVPISGLLAPRVTPLAGLENPAQHRANSAFYSDCGEINNVKLFTNHF